MCEDGGCCKDKTMTHCPHWSCPMDSLAPLQFWLENFNFTLLWGSRYAGLSRCACKDVRVQPGVYACIHACVSFNVLSVVTMSQLPLVTNRLCVLLPESCTSGQINYQVICHYLLSTGRRRSRPTTHLPLCLYVSSEMETQKHSRIFGCVL